MLYRIGTEAEIRALDGCFPQGVIDQLTRCVRVLDCSYGTKRDYLVSGGYALLAEDRNDVSAICAVVDVEVCLYEWVERLDGGFLSILYLLNDDFAVVVFMPEEYAPAVVFRNMED